MRAGTIAILALAFPLAVSANITGTQTLAAGQKLDLDTGAVSPSSGDVVWISSSGDVELDAFGSATLANVPSSVTAANFSSITQAQLLGYTYNRTAFYTPAANTIFAVHTNQNDYAAVLITAIAPDQSAITLQFITFTAPSISQVMNNYGLIPAGFPNSGIALGSLFIVKGGSMASATTPVLQSSAAPGLSTTLNGASVTVTVNGTAAPSPVFYYASATQLALVMPSNTPLGAGTITVTYNGQTSAPYSIQVVASAMGFAAYYGNGSGFGIATNPGTGTFYNYTNSIPPGTTVVLWGSGLGADAARDTTFAVPVGGFSISGLSAIYVGGIAATVQYQGASGYPGVNQLNVVIPANAPSGCHVPVVGVSAAGVPTNSITLPIGTGVCQDPALGLTGTMLSSLSAQATVHVGSITLTEPFDSRGNVLTNSGAPLSIGFLTYTGAGYGAAAGVVSSGGCIAGANPSSDAIGGLIPGEIMVIGENVVLVPSMASTESFQLLPGAFTTPGQSITLQADGSNQMGGFTTVITTPSPLLSWTNQSAASPITRSAGLHVTWTGGQSGTYVNISGSATTPNASGYFQCLAPLSAGQFTVPSYVFQALPATSTASVTVVDQTVPQPFSASGVDYAYGFGNDGQTVSATLQ